MMAAVLVGFVFGVSATLVVLLLIRKDGHPRGEEYHEPTITFPRSSKANNRLLSGIPIDVTYH